MKKSLLAIAALSTIAGAAQAQSSVTLFGTLDVGAYAVNQALPKTTAVPNSAVWGVVGNTVATSIWGIKGSEDLGGGLKANFYAESGINPRNGTLGQTGGEQTITAFGASAPTVTLFDRGLTVGLQGKWGSLDVGNKLNTFLASHGGILPVAGNSVATNAAANQNYGLFFVHNSLTYTMPTMAGFNAALQYGAGNAVNDSASGSVVNGAVDYTVGGLNVRAAGQFLQSKGTPISANYLGSNVTTSTNSPAIATYLVGAKYAVGAFTLGGGWVANSVNYTGTKGTNATTPTYQLNNFQAGVGYQATPAILLGLSWIGNTGGSNLINAQARYAFSKRTQAYAQLGVAANGKGLGGTGLGNLYAIHGASGSSFSSSTALAAPNFTQTAFGLGLIHTF